MCILLPQEKREKGKLVYFPFLPSGTLYLLLSLPPIPSAWSAPSYIYQPKPFLFIFFPCANFFLSFYFCENIYFSTYSLLLLLRHFSGEFNFCFLLLNFTIYLPIFRFITFQVSMYASEFLAKEIESGLLIIRVLLHYLFLFSIRDIFILLMH